MDLLSAMRTAADPILRSSAWQEAAAQAKDKAPDLGSIGKMAELDSLGKVPGMGIGGSSTSGLSGIAGNSPSGLAGISKGRSFDTLLGDFVREVNDKQLEAADASRALMSGEKIPLHRVMIASEEAGVSFQLMVEVRNKVLEAYQELMRMQI